MVSSYTSYFIPSVTLIGIGASKQIPEKIKALGGSKPLVVTDKGITGCGLTKQITDLLDAAGMKYEVYDETIPGKKGHPAYEFKAYPVLYHFDPGLYSRVESK